MLLCAGRCGDCAGRFVRKENGEMGRDMEEGKGTTGKDGAIDLRQT